MQDLIPKIRKNFSIFLLFVMATMFVSCASDKQPALVNDPSSKHESTMPWNKQETWETQGQMGGITDRR